MPDLTPCAAAYHQLLQVSRLVSITRVQWEDRVFVDDFNNGVEFAVVFCSFGLPCCGGSLLLERPRFTSVDGVVIRGGFTYR